LNAALVASLLATVALALAPGFILVSTMAWSESPFIAWLLLAFIALRSFSERGGLGVLYMAGLCLGGALLTRYAAVAFVGAAAVWVVAVGWRESRWRAVVLGAVLFAIASLPLALWLLLPAEAGHSGAPRSLVFHPVDLPRLIQGLSVVGEWFQSRVFGVGVAVCFVLALVGMIVFALCSRTTARAERSFVGLCVVSVGSYVAFLLISMSFFDFYTPLDLRILFPALVVLSVASGVAAGRISANGSVHLALVAVVLAVFLVSGLPALSRDVAANIRQIPGYFNQGVRGLPILSFARDLSGVAVYSNAPELLRLSGGMRDVKMLPAFQDMARNQPAAGYQAQMVSLVSEIREGRAVVVYINAFAWRAYLPEASVFAQAQAGALVYEGGDGWVLAGEPAPPQN
jgi:4-amino-4-deoxy-L-arabinose transferase-like glycosyltransferase